MKKHTQRHVVVDNSTLKDMRAAFTAARARTQVSRGRLSFDRLLPLYADPQMTLQDIADRDGVSRQAAWANGKNYFAKLFGDESMQVMSRVCVQQKRQARLRSLEGKQPAHVRRVGELARTHGLSMSYVLISNGHLLSSKLLKIEEKETIVLLSRQALVLKGRSYANFSLKESTLQGLQMVVLCVWVEEYPKQYYIYRAKDLVGLARGVGRVVYLYISLDETARPRQLGRPDPKNHKSAWHLFRDC